MHADAGCSMMLRVAAVWPPRPLPGFVRVRWTARRDECNAVFTATHQHIVKPSVINHVAGSRGIMIRERGILGQRHTSQRARFSRRHSQPCCCAVWGSKQRFNGGQQQTAGCFI